MRFKPQEVAKAARKWFDGIDILQRDLTMIVGYALACAEGPVVTLAVDSTGAELIRRDPEMPT